MKRTSRVLSSHMKLIQLRMTEHILTLNGDEWPVKHQYDLPSLGFSVEVRMNEKQQAAYVNAKVVQGDVVRYAGRGALRSYAEAGLYKSVSEELFNVAEALGVPSQDVWPFIEQLPTFTDCGVKISDVEIFEAPIRDLLSRGAEPYEVVRCLGISRDLYEFVTGTELPLEPMERTVVALAEDDPVW